MVEQLTLNQWVRGSSPRRCTSKKDRFKTCLFCWCILRRRVRDTAVTLVIGNVKSAVVRIRESEYCRGFPQAGNGKVSRRCKISRCYKTCLFCWCALRGRVRGTAVTLAIGNVKSGVVRIRESEYCRGFPQAGNGKVSRRCKISRCYKTCLFCWCALRGRVRGTAVTLAIGNVKSGVVRIRVSEYCRVFPQAGNGKVSRRYKMSRGYNTCLLGLNVKCCGADYKDSGSGFIRREKSGRIFNNRLSRVFMAASLSCTGYF